MHIYIIALYMAYIALYRPRSLAPSLVKAFASTEINSPGFSASQTPRCFQGTQRQGSASHCFC